MWDSLRPGSCLRTPGIGAGPSRLRPRSRPPSPRSVPEACSGTVRVRGGAGLAVGANGVSELVGLHAANPKDASQLGVQAHHPQMIRKEGSFTLKGDAFGTSRV